MKKLFVLINVSTNFLAASKPGKILLGAFILMVLHYSSLMASQSDVGFADDEWAIDSVSDKWIKLSVNGQVTHGDRLKIYLFKNKCERPSLITSVYTYAENTEIQNLSGRYLESKLAGSNIMVKVHSVSPFLLGHTAIVEIGSLPITLIKSWLSPQETITLEFIDSNDIKISDYFDIAENTWSTNGLSRILAKSLKICKDL